MINKLLLVLLFLLVIPNYSQDLIVKNHQQSIMVKPNLNKQFLYFEKNNLFNNTQKTNELNNNDLIWITDVNINYRISNNIPQTIETDTYQDQVNRSTYDNRGKIYLTSDLGAIKKLNKNIGLGISHFLGIDWGFGLRNGIKLKYRQWLKNGSFFDISPGIVLLDLNFNSPGFTSSIDWWKNEYFALTLLLEYLPSHKNYYEKLTSDEGNLDIITTEYEKDIGIYFGIKTGSQVGLIGNSVYYGVILIGITALLTSPQYLDHY